MTLAPAPHDGELRQGDICIIRGLPIWNVGAAETQSDSNGVLSRFVLPPHKVFEYDQLTGGVAVIVCSHDCDVENPRSRTGIVVAPLSRTPANPTSAEFEQIMASSDLVDGLLHYVQFFPIVMQDQKGVDVSLVADFSALVTIARADKAVTMLRDGRHLTMDDETRTKFRRKLGLFFGRDYQMARD